MFDIEACATNDQFPNARNETAFITMIQFIDLGAKEYHVMHLDLQFHPELLSDRLGLSDFTLHVTVFPSSCLLAQSFILYLKRQLISTLVVGFNSSSTEIYRCTKSDPESEYVKDVETHGYDLGMILKHANISYIPINNKYSVSPARFNQTS